jgi:hypothetical protein
MEERRLQVRWKEPPLVFFTEAITQVAVSQNSCLASVHGILHEVHPYCDSGSFLISNSTGLQPRVAEASGV